MTGQCGDDSASCSGLAARDREVMVESDREAGDRLRRQSAVTPDEGRDSSRPVDHQSARLEPAQQRQPVDLDETQGAPDLDVRGNHGLDRRDLAGKALEHLGTITTTDHQPRPIAAAPDSDLARHPLGIDHGHAAGADRQVIDVRASARDAAVVQEGDLGTAEKTLEPSCCSLFSDRTTQPRLLVLRATAESEKGSADQWVALTRPCFASGTPTFVLGSRTAAGLIGSGHYD